MAAILDAILDFSARTNFRQCIPLVSQSTGYKVHFGICHVLLYFYEHPTFILALKVTLLFVLKLFCNPKDQHLLFSDSSAKQRACTFLLSDCSATQRTNIFCCQTVLLPKGPIPFVVRLFCYQKDQYLLLSDC